MSKPSQYSNRDLSTCYFPKHEGEEWEDVVQEDRKYVEWLVFESDKLSDELTDYLTELLEDA